MASRQATRHVVSLLTGSVDSAVAALMLKRKGYFVSGIFVHNKYLPAAVCEAQLERASLASKELGISLREVTLSDTQWDILTSNALAEYKRGGIPDLLVLYTRFITLGGAVDAVSDMFGQDAMATEHYARTTAGLDVSHVHKIQGVELLRAVDQFHDQSSLLSQVPPQILKQTLFPLGSLDKEVIPHIAGTAGLGKLKEGQEVDLYTMKTYLQQGITKELPAKHGRLLHVETYKSLGSHTDFYNHYIGQSVDIDGQEFCVVSKDVESGDIMMAPGRDHPALFCDNLFTSLAHWTGSVPYNFYEKQMMECEYKFTLGQLPGRCTLTVGMNNEYCGNDHVILSSPAPLRAVQPGHFCTFYQGELCMGSARVLRPGPSRYAMNYHHYRSQQESISNQEQSTDSLNNPIKHFISKFIGTAS